MEDAEIKYDCRYFVGEKPCKFKRACKGCPEYKPMGFKLLIIKLGAMGDVLRTTPILEALKKRHPGCHITWLVERDSYELLRHNPDIDKILFFNWKTVLRLQVERFDLLISLEKIDPAIALAESVPAGKKVGFGMNRHGTIRPLNPESLYALELGINDQLKFFENIKSYQQIIFEVIGIPYNGERYSLRLDPKEVEFAGRLLKERGVDQKRPVVGVSPGAGRVFANKAWTVSGYIRLIDRLMNDFDIQVLLLGGEREEEVNRTIREGINGKVTDIGTGHSMERFLAIVDRCDMLICGDTLHLHVAIALKKKVLAIFGPTCHQEIDLYSRGGKVVSHKDCAPCYKPVCDIKPNCMEVVSEEDVFEKAAKLIGSLRD